MNISHDREKKDGHMNEAVTVKDVARRADVSVGTVSRVFHNQSTVTEERRLRVLQAAADLGYTRKSRKGAEHRQSPFVKEVGFLYCSFVDTTAFASNPFWSHILRGVEKEAHQSNIKVTYKAIGDLAATPRDLTVALQALHLDGMLLVGPAERETVALLKKMNIPLILIDNHIPGLSVDSVLCDNFEGARMAVTFLIEQGHRKIAFIGGPTIPGRARSLNRIYTLERRSAGYRTALLDAGLPVEYELFETTHLSPQSGYDACRRLLAQELPFTAVFCVNDEVALGALKALQEAGKRVPEDISLIGFDDIDLVEHITPALTTVRINKEAMGSLALKTLIERSRDPTSPSISCILEVSLVQRDTVGPCRI